MDKVKALLLGVWNKAVALWTYSRTIFVNVVGALLIVGNELIPYLMNVNFDDLVGVDNHMISVFIGLALNGLNVLLRLYTVAPVGASLNARVAAVNIVADVSEEEAKLAASPKAD